MRARYYNLDIKRFINQDVIQGSLDNAITLNRFAYANGNPISYLDPFGLYVANNGVPEDLYERLETEKYQRLKEEKAERQKEIKRLNRELEWNQFWGGINIAVCDTTATVTKGFFENMPCVNVAYADAKGIIGALTDPNFNQSQWEQEFYNAMNSTLLFGVTEGIFSYWSGKPVASVGNSISKEAGKPSNDLVDLYRAVSPEEFDDIMKINGFRPSPTGLDGKQFGLDFDEILNLANQKTMKDTAAIIKVQIPRSIFNQLDHTLVDKLFLKSGSVTVLEDMYSVFNESIKSIQYVY